MTDLERPIWQRRWFQWLLVVLVLLLVASFVMPPVLRLVYAIRPVLLPVLLAAAAAYVFNPPVTWAQRFLRLPRWAGTASAMLLGLVAVAAVLLAVVPPVQDQGTDLILKLKNEYPNLVVELIGQPGSGQGSADTRLAPDAAAADPDRPADASVADGAAVPGSVWARMLLWLPEPQHRRQIIQNLADQLRNLSWPQIRDLALKSLDVGVGMVGSAISFTSYAILAAVVMGFCFYFFSWKYDRITAWFVPFIPSRSRERTLDILGKMDASVAAFIRGRLIQASMMAAILSIGWCVVGVPYWLLLGLLSGVLNLVPYAAIIGWLVATALALVDHLSGGGSFSVMVLFWPTLVYAAAQLLDGWLVEPLVQGKATDLDPLTVLLVVLIGGSLAGLLGLIVAIPLAACVKLLAKELLLPKLRQLAAGEQGPEGVP